MRVACLGGVPLFLLALGHEAAGQISPPGPETLLQPPEVQPVTPITQAEWFRPVASLVLPGTGQILAGDERAAIYLIAEAFLVTRFLTLHAEGGREGDRFRDLALTVARAPFDPSVRDTAFEYFEAMGEFIESGPVDADPTTRELEPTTDQRTFNGSIWALARETFLPPGDSLADPDSPEYQRALEFYRERAVGPNFRWSWRNAGLEQDLFRQTIRQSDQAFRRATTHLGLLLVNHLLSTVDAFVSTRLSGNGRPVELQTLVWSAARRPYRLRGALVVTVGF